MLFSAWRSISNKRTQSSLLVLVPVEFTAGSRRFLTNKPELQLCNVKLWETLLNFKAHCSHSRRTCQGPGDFNRIDPTMKTVGQMMMSSQRQCPTTSNERSKNIKSMRNDLLCCVELPWSCGFLIVWFYDVVFCDSVVVLFVIMWFCDYNNCDWIII